MNTSPIPLPELGQVESKSLYYYSLSLTIVDKEWPRKDESSAPPASIDSRIPSQ